MDEAIIEEQRAKLQREESRRIAAAQASEEQKRRLSEAKETEEKMIQLEKAASMEQQMLAKSLAEAEQARRVEEAKAEEEAAEQARLSQRMQVVEDMERERERRAHHALSRCTAALPSGLRGLCPLRRAHAPQPCPPVHATSRAASLHVQAGAC